MTQIVSPKLLGETPPVGYRKLAGVTVEETESLQEEEAFPVVGLGEFSGRTGRGGIFRDMSPVQEGEVLYYYDDAFYRDRAAVTRRRQNGGTVYYLGCSPDGETTARLVY